MTEAALNAKNTYMRVWRSKNRDKCNKYLKSWRERNPQKIREYNARYWEKKSGDNEIL